MNLPTKIRYDIECLCIYNVREDPVFSALLKLLRSTDTEEVIENYSDFFHALSSSLSFQEYTAGLILTHDNVFSKTAAGKQAHLLSPAVMNGVKSDLKKLEAIASVKPENIIEAVPNLEIREILKTLPGWEEGHPLPPLAHPWAEQLDALIRYYEKNGYGEYSSHLAFNWRNKALIPISSTDSVTLPDLKRYEAQHQKIIENTESFLAGLPANNMLLYGDRGTGKSSTVHAILNEYAQQGLRMIEISKNSIGDLTVIRELIADNPMKFILFIDDLSFDFHDDSFGELKAALEGSLSGKQPNALIYATSNRRHLIKENFSDRENDVSRRDTMQEQLSLSDRFGLIVTFLNPDKQEFLDIVEKIADDRELKHIDRQRLFSLAEQWAMRKGGRSPRCAKQFVDYVESAVKRGKEW